MITKVENGKLMLKKNSSGKIGSNGSNTIKIAKDQIFIKQSGSQGSGITLSTNTRSRSLSNSKFSKKKVTSPTQPQQMENDHEDMGSGNKQGN